MPQIPKEEFSQVAALPFRIKDGKIEVLLVTSRETKRWLIPKGWPMKGKKPHKAAAQEAEEEAGVKGEIKNKPLGSYDYWKPDGSRWKRRRIRFLSQPLPISSEACPNTSDHLAQRGRSQILGPFRERKALQEVFPVTRAAKRRSLAICRHGRRFR